MTNTLRGRRSLRKQAEPASQAERTAWASGGHTQECPCWSGMSARTEGDAQGTGGVHVQPGPTSKPRLYVPPWFPSRGKRDSLSLKGREGALIDDALKEVSGLHGTPSNSIPFSGCLAPWFLFFHPIKRLWKSA